MSREFRAQNSVLHPGPREGLLSSKRLLGMCHWLGSHFHNWTDYNLVLEWGRKFSGLVWDKKILVTEQGFKNRKIRG